MNKEGSDFILQKEDVYVNTFLNLLMKISNMINSAEFCVLRMAIMRDYIIVS